MATNDSPTSAGPAWALVALTYLTIVDLATGIWALADPAGWYRTFPGLGRHWVAADPPYNRHLVTDVGAGFLAVGVVLLMALLWRQRRVLQVALIGSLAHDLPHVLFHVLHPAAALSSADRASSTGGLGLNTALAVVLLVVISMSHRTSAPANSAASA